VQLLPNFGRITSNGAWTAWFGHLVQPGTTTECTGANAPPGSSILNCELVQHGWRPDDPSQSDSVHPNPAGYFPAFPISAIDQPHAPPNLRAVAPFTDPHLGEEPYGPAPYYQLEYYKQLVPNAEVTLPGSTCPTCNNGTPAPDTVTAANTWTPFDLALLVERLGGAVVATHSQSGVMGHHMTRILKERGTLDLLKGLITLEGSCSLAASGLTAADFDDIPYLALKGDYTRPSASCKDTTVAAINARRASGQGTAKAEWIALDDPSYNGAFNGTTHMMMLGTNNLDVADVLLKWVDENVPSKGRGKKK
jgi:hypothetical protein